MSLENERGREEYIITSLNCPEWFIFLHFIAPHIVDVTVTCVIFHLHGRGNSASDSVWLINVSCTFGVAPFSTHWQGSIATVSDASTLTSGGNLRAGCRPPEIWCSAPPTWNSNLLGAYQAPFHCSVLYTSLMLPTSPPSAPIPVFPSLSSALDHSWPMGHLHVSGKRKSPSSGPVRDETTAAMCFYLPLRENWGVGDTQFPSSSAHASGTQQERELSATERFCCLVQLWHTAANNGESSSVRTDSLPERMEPGQRSVWERLF